MGDVVRWVDTQEVAEVAGILEATGVPEALQAARATWQRDDRQRSSVYTTAETVLEPFAAGGSRPPGADPADTPPYGTPAVPFAASFEHPAAGPGGVAPADVTAGGLDPRDVDPAALLLGSNTLYLCAPAHDQRRLRAVFCALVKQVLEAAFERSGRTGDPLDPPLLVVLDEAANIAPLAELDGLAATCAGHGVQLVTVWQDLSQITARYGERGATVVNNHRAKIFLSGTSDPRTLDHASQLVGEEELLVPSVTKNPGGARTVTTSPVRRPLLAARGPPPPGAVDRGPRLRVPPAGAPRPAAVVRRPAPGRTGRVGPPARGAGQVRRARMRARLRHFQMQSTSSRPASSSQTSWVARSQSWSEGSSSVPISWRQRAWRAGVGLATMSRLATTPPGESRPATSARRERLRASGRWWRAKHDTTASNRPPAGPSDGSGWVRSWRTTSAAPSSRPAAAASIVSEKSMHTAAEPG